MVLTLTNSVACLEVALEVTWLQVALGVACLKVALEVTWLQVALGVACLEVALGVALETLLVLETVCGSDGTRKPSTGKGEFTRKANPPKSYFYEE